MRRIPKPIRESPYEMRIEAVVGVMQMILNRIPQCNPLAPLLLENPCSIEGSN